VRLAVVEEETVGQALTFAWRKAGEKGPTRGAKTKKRSTRSRAMIVSRE
jgi:hypothetical protein